MYAAIQLSMPGPGNVAARIYKRGYIPGLYFGPIGKAVQAGNMQTGEAKVDRKQTASPVAVNEVEVKVMYM